MDGRSKRTSGWEVTDAPDLSIYDWNIGIAVQQYELMKETARTATSILYTWKWSTKDVPCGVYVGVVNYTIGGQPVIGNAVGDRVRDFLEARGWKDNQIAGDHSVGFKDACGRVRCCR